MYRGLKALLAVTAFTLAGCASPTPPKVTFYSDGASVEVAPAQYCEPTGENCTQPPKDPVGRLPVPGRAPLQISVPGEVTKTPWQIAFVYRDMQGRQQNGRSSVMAPDERHAFKLTLPPDGERLEHVEVQQYSATLTPGAEGGVDFGISGSWVLNTR